MGCHPSKSNAPPSLPLPQPSPSQSKPPGEPKPVGEEPKETVEEKPKKSPESQSNFDGEEELGKPVEKLKQLPHRYGDIVGQADMPSIGDLEEHKFSGIFLNHRRKKYWVDERTGCNCFMLYARDLLITWSENSQYWKWFPLKETSNVYVEVAALVNVCWLEIHGRLEVSYLTPGATYEVEFVVMITHTACGWNAPVNLRLTDPEGNVQKHTESLMGKPRGEWIALMVGEFQTTAAGIGEVEISLFEYEDGAWKNGLVVKGICIRPRSG